MIFTKYTSSFLVEELRDARAENKLHQSDSDNLKISEGDAVFENAVLFLRDALITREFNDAIKCGDPGRVVLVLKTWALSFRGNGRTKYAHEMLHLIHNLTSVWPPSVRDIVLKNWIVNPSGEANRFVELDLVQEHLNFKIKVAYKARGSNASWEWLETISPCVSALSDLQKTFNDSLGGKQGVKHAPPDLQADIESLMQSLPDHGVYNIQKGRTLKDDEIVKDAISTGLHNLTAGEKNPLAEYNLSFKKLQQRRKMKPVTDVATYLERIAHSDTPPADQDVKTEPDTIEDPDLHAIFSSNLEDIDESDYTTLPRLTEDDVAFDMDEIDAEDEEVDTDESISSDEADFESD